MVHRSEAVRRGRDRGFTLVELLVVIVILGILSTVTVFAVTGVDNRSQEVSCQADHKTLEVAVETYRVQHPSDGSIAETDLISTGFLTQLSEYYDVVDGSIVPRSGNKAGCA